MNNQSNEQAHEEALRALENMQTHLEDKSSNIKQFWMAQKQALPLVQAFKGLQSRTLWRRYKDLIAQARQLSDFKEVDTAFEMDQINACIEDLSHVWENFDQAKKSVNTTHLSAHLMGRDNLFNHYESIYKTLKALEPLTHRLPLLRKDLMNVDTPFKVKKGTFDRLQTLADQVFDAKKKGLDELVGMLKEDVEVLGNQLKALEESEVDTTSFRCFKLLKALQQITKDLRLPRSIFGEFKEKFNAAWLVIAPYRQKAQAQTDEKKQQEAEAKALAQAQLEQEKAKVLENKKAFDALLVELRDSFSKKGAHAHEKLSKARELAHSFEDRLACEQVSLQLQSSDLEEGVETDEFIEHLEQKLDELHKLIGAGSLDIEKGLVYQEHKMWLESLLDSVLSKVNLG